MLSCRLCQVPWCCWFGFLAHPCHSIDLSDWCLVFPTKLFELEAQGCAFVSRYQELEHSS